MHEGKDFLNQRYDESFIKRASERRHKLAYKKIHVGSEANKRLDRILDLLFQLHQNYYFAYYDASSILGGVLLEQAIIVLLEEKIEREGKITIKDGREYVEIHDSKMLVNYPLVVLVKSASYFGFISRDSFDVVKTLRLARNFLLHDSLPEFKLQNGLYISELILKVNKDGENLKVIVSLSKEEVERRVLDEESSAIWAYYILSRTRGIISEMFEERVSIFPPKY